MDKREVLRRLDRLHFKMIEEEDDLKKCYDASKGDEPLDYGFYGKISGVKWARGMLERIGAAIDHIDEPPEVTEMCPACEREITLLWDTERDGYKAYCPYCGERLMLCSACHDDEFACDYDSETDSCIHNPKIADEEGTEK